MPSIALIGLGSNLGDRRATLDGAVSALGATPGIRIVAVSSYHETEPEGGPPGQGRYLNAVARIETTLDPAALLARLQSIEDRFGRVRAVRWGERTLDLDLLLFDDRIIETAELTVPHPRLAERRFVLEPLAEVAGDAVEPRSGRTVGELLGNLDRAGG
jgi:2-amino-4-hydroxy-6-hydroxymethyldihydropteridine diphosphokinase